jgi:hypothetical protein
VATRRAAPGTARGERPEDVKGSAAINIGYDSVRSVACRSSNRKVRRYWVCSRYTRGRRDLIAPWWIPTPGQGWTNSNSRPERSSHRGRTAPVGFLLHTAKVIRVPLRQGIYFQIHYFLGFSIFKKPCKVKFKQNFRKTIKTTNIMVCRCHMKIY